MNKKISSEKGRWKSRIQDILGHKIAERLIQFEERHVEGFILDKIESGSSYENAFIKKTHVSFFINKRPTNKLASIHQVLESYYRKYAPNTKYIAILNLHVDSRDYDVNLAVDKRTAFIRKDF